MNCCEILLLFCMGLTCEASYLWRITPPKGRGADSFLFGSLHVPHAKIYPSLADEVKKAFKDSDSCGFEMDAADSRYKKQSAGDELLDSFLSAMAISEGKSVHPLETFEEYSRNNGAFTEMLYKGAAELEAIDPDILEEVTDNLLGDQPVEDVSAADLPRMLLLSGEETILPKYLKGEIADRFDPLLGVKGLPPSFFRDVIETHYTALMKKRNRRMAERMTTLVTENQDEVFFFAVGLQHLLGKGKIQEVLENAGYSVQKVSPQEKEMDSLRESGEL